jgi:hypothetical protein
MAATPSCDAGAPEEEKMYYRMLGNTGLKVSVLAYGFWATFGSKSDLQKEGEGVERAKACLRTARQAGVNLFDNAEVYGSGEAEHIMGVALQELQVRHTHTQRDRDTQLLLASVSVCVYVCMYVCMYVCNVCKCVFSNVCFQICLSVSFPTLTITDCINIYLLTHLQKEDPVLWRRSDLVITTKIFWGGSGANEAGLSRKHVREGMAASLQRLQLDYVDLVFCHRPDPLTPTETVSAVTLALTRL